MAASNKTYLNSIISCLLILCAGKFALAENKCPTTGLPCSCNEAIQIFTHGLNNDPYKIEAADIEGIKLGSDCKNSIDEKLAKGSIEISKVFRGTNAEDKYSVGSFLTFVSQTALDKAIRRFPVDTSDITDPKTASKPAVCIPDGTQRSKAVKDDSKIEVVSLPPPQDIDGIVRVDPAKVVNTNCLIYLPLPYVVATSSSLHRELYPHDSSYIISALIRTGKPQNIDLARNLLDNFFFEIEKFGYPLNGNRGYYLTRSQNNVIPANIWEYFEATRDYAWMENKGLPNAVNILEYWDTRMGVINLGNEDDEDDEDMEGHRWFATGTGPCKEVWESRGAHQSFYFRVLYELVKLGLTPDPKRPAYAQGFDYNRVVHTASNVQSDQWKKKEALKPINIKFDEPEITKELAGHTYILSGKVSASGKDGPAIELNGVFYALTPKYYFNDRASRASGYDTCHLYGPFNSFVDQFVDAAHNAQIFRANADVARMYDVLARRYQNIDTKKHNDYREKFDLYKFKADTLKDLILKYLWNEKLGMIFNYNNHTHTQRAVYPFTSSAYAIWAELFDVEMDKEKNMLMQTVDYLSKNLEGPAGYYASGVETGLHWDKPYVWPIQQGMIVHGLRKYAGIFNQKGMKNESEKLKIVADRIALKYLSANFADWVESKGKEIKEKVGPGKEKLITGYATGANYTWNLAAVWDLYAGLTPEAKGVFDRFTATIAEE